MFLGLFVSAYVARYLGPKQFGLLSYAVSFVGLFTAIATLGLDSILVRELVKDAHKEDELLGTAFLLRLIGAFGMLTVLAIAVKFTSNDHYTNVLIFIIATSAIFRSFNVIDFYFQSKVLSKYVVYANIISLFISSIVKIALIYYRAPLIYFALVVLFDSFVMACGFIYFFFKHSKFKIQNLKFKRETAISLLKDSWPLILSGGILMIQARIDQVMIQEFRGSVEVGYYSVAMRLIETITFMPMILKNSLFPAIQNAKKYSEKIYINRLLNFYRLNFLLFLVFAIPIFFFSKKIVILLFGKSYQPAGILLAFLSVRLFFTNMGVARGTYMLSENLMKFSMITMTLGTIVNVLLNYLWIPDYGAKGAVVATIISFTFTIYIVDVFYDKTRQNIFLQVKSIFTFYKLNLRS